MSYSRWFSSYWYTFWSSESGDVYKDDQIFEICDFDGLRFTYAEIKEDIDSCIDRVRLHYSLEHEIIINSNYYVGKDGELSLSEKKIKKKPIKLKESQLEELKEYMLEFLEDVENDNDLF